MSPFPPWCRSPLSLSDTNQLALDRSLVYLHNCLLSASGALLLAKLLL